MEILTKRDATFMKRVVYMLMKHNVLPKESKILAEVEGIDPTEAIRIMTTPDPKGKGSIFARIAENILDHLPEVLDIALAPSSTVAVPCVAVPCVPPGTVSLNSNFQRPVQDADSITSKDFTTLLNSARAHEKARLTSVQLIAFMESDEPSQKAVFNIVMSLLQHYKNFNAMIERFQVLNVGPADSWATYLFTSATKKPSQVVSPISAFSALWALGPVKRYIMATIAKQIMEHVGIPDASKETIAAAEKKWTKDALIEYIIEPLRTVEEHADNFEDSTLTNIAKQKLKSVAGM